MDKIFKYRCKKTEGLDRPICENMSDVVKIKCTDREIDGVTYRVWSAFKNEVSATDKLENLMLNNLESSESEKQEEEILTLKM